VNYSGDGQLDQKEKYSGDLAARTLKGEVIFDKGKVAFAKGRDKRRAIWVDTRIARGLK
jgi:hypothetical protein